MDQNTHQPLKIVFFGTPPFAVRILDALCKDPNVLVQAVVTQPDRPCGRGRVCKASAVKEFAKAKNLNILQPATLKDSALFKDLQSFQADFFIVAAFGLIFPEPVLNIPSCGSLNVHASLLPRYRGASPIQAALLAGDHVTGITIMRMVKELDAGPLLLQRAMGIDINDTAQTLHDQLAEMGARMMREALERHRAGTLVPIEQDHALATFAPRLCKNQGLINWNQPARRVHDHIRAMHPWPGAFFYLPGGRSALKKVTIHPGKIGQHVEANLLPGSFLDMQDGMLAITCQDSTYLVERFHPADAKLMDAKAFRCGYLQNIFPGDNLCESVSP